MQSLNLIAKQPPRIRLCELGIFFILFLTYNLSAAAINGINGQFVQPSDDKHRGVNWVGGRHVVQAEEMLVLNKIHVNWIVQTPFCYQKNENDTEIHMATSGYAWGESDHGILETGRLAHNAGIKVMLKPHLWLVNMENGAWRGTIEMENEENWSLWFQSYEKFILHYAQLAKRGQFEALCIGTELHKSSVGREADWRNLIGKIRGVYSGKITYAANWDREFKEIQFWDALDYISIQAYFPLTDKLSPEVSEIKNGWCDFTTGIEKVQQQFNIPVIFTEVGYKSTSDAAIEPWIWPQNPKFSKSKINLQTQVNCYEALFESFWHKDWFGGTYIWKWFPAHNRSGGKDHRGFTPQNKPAEQVLRRWYGK